AAWRRDPRRARPGPRSAQTRAPPAPEDPGLIASATAPCSIATPHVHTCALAVQHCDTPCAHVRTCRAALRHPVCTRAHLPCSIATPRVHTCALAVLHCDTPCAHVHPKPVTCDPSLVTCDSHPRAPSPPPVVQSPNQ